MNLTIACSYCRRQLILKLPAKLEINGRGGKIGPPVHCDACGSTTSIEISTKRVRKGKGMKQIEERAAAKLAAYVSQARHTNKLIGDALLAQPGCTCKAAFERRSARYDDGNDGGHFLSTGWSQDKAAGGMLPTLPRHYHQCPCHDTDEERRIQMSTPIGRHTAAVNTSEEQTR